MSDKNIECFCGCDKSCLDARDHIYSAKEHDEFPKSYINPMNTVKNQGSVSSCVGNGIAAVAEYFNLSQNNITDPMSAGFIYGMRTDGYSGEGLSIRTGLNTYLKYGIPYLVDFEYEEEVPGIINKVNSVMNSDGVKEFKEKIYKNRCSEYFSIKVDKNFTKNMKKALINHGPVLFCLKWSNATLDENNVIKFSGSALGYHCVTVYGWNEYGWLIQNSWGKYWGDKGRACVAYNDSSITEAWGVCDTIYGKDGNIVTPVRDWRFHIRQFFYDIANKITYIRNKIISVFKKK